MGSISCGKRLVISNTKFCFLYFYSAFILSTIHNSRAQSVRALYVFGDSLVDVGNNNHLQLSLIKANIPYNGIDYPGNKATGRFSNGKNAADFAAEKLGLSSPPPYLARPNDVYVKGVSFASGGAGIFNTTSQDQGNIKRTIPLPQQVSYFSSVRQGLIKQMGSPSAADEHLSKSIFAVVIGSNDIIGYFNDGSEASKKTAPQQYVDQMLSAFKDVLKGIYGLGGRKFVIIGLSPIGCAPKQRFRSEKDECREDVNYWSKKYNEGLVQMLRGLKSSQLADFHYSYFDVYSVFENFIARPAYYGFNETKTACCGLGRLRAQLPCTPLALFCKERSSHLFWDIYHPTEATARTFIDMLFQGSELYVSPVTVQQLIAA